MKYAAPLGNTDPDARYADPVEGTIPASAIEQPLREIASVIASMGIVPSETDLTQLDQAIDMKVASVQPDLWEFMTRAEFTSNDLVSRDDLVRYVDARIASEKYELCEFYYFRNPVARPGFLPAQGQVIENAADLYPQAYAYLQTAEGQRLCVTEKEWQAMSKATWAAGAGWNGLGGVPCFALDTAAKALRLPDLRGMYAEAAGFDGLAVGAAHGDAIKSHVITAQSGSQAGYFLVSASNGQTILSSNNNGTPLTYNGSARYEGGIATKPRAWGALACVYLGGQNE